MNSIYVGDIIQATDFISEAGTIIIPGTIGQVSHIDALGMAVVQWGNGLISALDPHRNKFNII